MTSIAKYLLQLTGQIKALEQKKKKNKKGPVNSTMTGDDT